MRSFSSLSFNEAVYESFNQLSAIEKDLIYFLALFFKSKKSQLSTQKIHINTEDYRIFQNLNNQQAYNHLLEGLGFLFEQDFTYQQIELDGSVSKVATRWVASYTWDSSNLRLGVYLTKATVNFLNIILNNQEIHLVNLTSTTHE